MIAGAGTQHVHDPTSYIACTWNKEFELEDEHRVELLSLDRSPIQHSHAGFQQPDRVFVSPLGIIQIDTVPRQLSYQLFLQGATDFVTVYHDAGGASPGLAPIRDQFGCGVKACGGG